MSATEGAKAIITNFPVYRNLLFFRVEIFSSGAKMPKIFIENFTLRTRDSPREKNKAFRKFSVRNIFVRERDDDNFSHELFGIEINANENKANYGIYNHIKTSFNNHLTLQQ